ncbi:MAG: hypothetical protein Ta2D_07540 [Rickettsiales bacterium]|nr:MAG: hypothetical protein Ta2D_07540 [Rickettsiales bacterium]
MPRVVVSKNGDDVKGAVESCPAGAFKKLEDDSYVINPNACIDCGVCQSIATEGSIVEDSEASEDDVNRNAENAE